MSSVLQNAIANASTLAEVERLKGLLQAGQIPGRERRSGQETVFCLCASSSCYTQSESKTV